MNTKIISKFVPCLTQKITTMTQKGCNAVTIYEESSVVCQPEFKLWTGNLNNEQFKELFDWLVEWEYELCTTPCGGNCENRDLTEIKIKLLEGTKNWYENGHQYLTEKGYAMTLIELNKLKEQCTIKKADQGES